MRCIFSKSFLSSLRRAFFLQPQSFGQLIYIHSDIPLCRVQLYMYYISPVKRGSEGTGVCACNLPFNQGLLCNPFLCTVPPIRAPLWWIFLLRLRMSSLSVWKYIFNGLKSPHLHTYNDFNYCKQNRYHICRNFHSSVCFLNINSNYGLHGMVHIYKDF